MKHSSKRIVAAILILSYSPMAPAQNEPNESQRQQEEIQRKLESCRETLAQQAIDWKKEADSLGRQVNESISILRSQENVINALERQALELGVENNNLSVKLATAESDLAELRVEHLTLEIESGVYKNKIDRLSGELSKSEKDIEETRRAQEAALDEARRQRASRVANLKKWEETASDRDALLAELESSRVEFAQKHQELVSTRELLASEKKRLLEIQEEVAETTTQLKSTRASVASVKEKVERSELVVRLAVIFAFSLTVLIIGYAVLHLLVIKADFNSDEAEEYAAHDDFLLREMIYQLAYYRQASSVVRLGAVGGFLVATGLGVVCAVYLHSELFGGFFDISQGQFWKVLAAAGVPLLFAVSAYNAVESRRLQAFQILNEIRKRVGISP